MRTEDTPLPRLVERRDALVRIARLTAAAAWPFAPARAQGPACVVRPQQTEGPYFVDTGLERSDIRTDPATGVSEPGMPLRIRFNVSRLTTQGCQPLADAQIELWQCNAQGVYSGVRDRYADARGRSFLRGFQRTDRAGNASFVTIYPGWYPGRTVHVHFTIRARTGGTRSDVFTSQLYFDDRLTDEIYMQAPYAERGVRPVRNADDGIFRRGGGELTLAVKPEGKLLAARFDIALQG